ncbi:MAG: DUF2442 domain-containing protein [Tannerellaceae bacterium]|jgi:hypothetical protein|nr:DUF2442 domain-containing protein [Tannerellaceae bacterium]
MKTTITKVWTDAEAVYIRTNTGDVFGERFADYPRLAAAQPAQLAHFECDNIGIRWEELDEDLSYRGFMTDAKRLAATH